VTEIEAHLNVCNNFNRYFCPLCYSQWAAIPASKKSGHRYPTCCGTGIRFTCFKCAGVLSLASNDKHKKSCVFDIVGWDKKVPEDWASKPM